jgi:hypothetical protein
MNFRFLAATAGLAAGAAVTFTALPAQAFVTSFTKGDIYVEIIGNDCGGICVDLGSVYSNVTGGAVAPPSQGTKTPGANDETLFDPVDTSAQTESWSFTEDHSIVTTGASPIEVKDLSSAFEIFWGSVDTHNRLTFSSGTEVTGQDIADALNSAGAFAPDPDVTSNDAGNFKFDAYVKFSAVQGSSFDAVTLDALGLGNGFAFEAATRKVSVPEPASVLGLAIAGLVGGGSMLKRREKSA